MIVRAVVPAAARPQVIRAMLTPALPSSVPMAPTTPGTSSFCRTSNGPTGTVKLTFMRESMLGRYGTISAEDLNLFLVTDAVDAAADHLRRHVDAALPELRHPSSVEEIAMPAERRISGEGTRYGRPPRRKSAPFE